MTTPTKLRSVLEEAKQHLRETIEEHQHDAPSAKKASEPSPNDHEPARSKLNTLLGRQSVPKRNLSVFQSVGVPQRPTYDMIADRVLGPHLPQHRTFLDQGSAYADHVAERLRHLQERLQSSPVEAASNERSSAYVGVEDDGQPVWSHVLQMQRGQSIHPIQGNGSTTEVEALMPKQSVPHERPPWPASMTWSTQGTFKQWFVGDENFEATQLCEAAIDEPAVRFNPIFIESEPQAGCSLLLHATGQAWLRRSEGHVLHITAADVVSVDPLSSFWKDAIPGATALVVDDVHEFAHHETWRHQLGVLLDHALNLGVQVLVGGRMNVEAFPASRLKEVLRSSTPAYLGAPSAATLMAFARWRCGQKNLLLSDVHLAQLARMPPAGWRSVDRRLEQITLAFSRGEVLLDHDDVTRVLEPSRDASPDPLEHKRVEDVAATLVGEVLDSVYSSVEPGGIDLRASLEPWGEDDYEPPGWEDGVLASHETERFEQALSDTIDKVTPGRPSVLDVHEREQFLLRDHESMDVHDVERAVDVLVDLDQAIDERMAVSDRASVSATSELNQLEEQMVVLAQRAMDADIETLITIADELRVLEERLVELDPDRAPLPAFEDDTPVRHRRPVTRRKTPKSTPVEDDLASYEPTGEWNIDGSDVRADELLEDEPSAPKKVRLARLERRTVLMGEEE